MKGYIRGAQYTTDPANKDEVLAISAEATGQKAEDFELTYNEHIGEIPATGKPNLVPSSRRWMGRSSSADCPVLIS